MLLTKLQLYNTLVNSDISEICRIVDPRMGTDIISDTDVLRSMISLPNTYESQSYQPNLPISQPSVTKSIVDELFDENSLMDIGNGDSDEITRFVKSTATSARSIDVLEWWKSNEQYYPTISKVARDLLAAQSSSVASEKVFSGSGDLIDEQRTSLSDEAIRACMLLNSWISKLG